MKQFRIDSFDSINIFLFDMYNRCEKTFDPAEDIRSLKDKKGAALFSEEESGYLNGVLTECFIFCLMNDLNMYTITTIVQYDFYQNKAVA
jgi:hypothetical protein